MKKLVLFLVLISCWIPNIFSDVHYYDSRGFYQGRAEYKPKQPSLGESFGKGLSEGFLRGMAINSQQNKKIKRIKTALHGILRNYTAKNHKKHMRLISISEFPTSFKIGLINLYNKYRKDRDSLEFSYSKRYKKLLNNIRFKNTKFDKNYFNKIKNRIDPYKKQRRLNRAIKTAPISKKDKKSLHKSINRYYRKRKSLDKKFNKEKHNLILSLI